MRVRRACACVRACVLRGGAEEGRAPGPRPRRLQLLLLLLRGVGHRRVLLVLLLLPLDLAGARAPEPCDRPGVRGGRARGRAAPSWEPPVRARVPPRWPPLVRGDEAQPRGPRGRGRSRRREPQTGELGCSLTEPLMARAPLRRADTRGSARPPGWVPARHAGKGRWPAGGRAAPSIRVSGPRGAHGGLQERVPKLGVPGTRPRASDREAWCPPCCVSQGGTQRRWRTGTALGNGRAFSGTRGH